MKQNKTNYLPLTFSEFETLTNQFARILSTKEAPVIIPSEAILGIEAIAAGVAAPGRTILNIVTGPYGSLFGKWLRRGGAAVAEVVTSFDEVATVGKVAQAIEQYKPCALSFVQAEAITGGTNPTEKILDLARRAGLVTIVDSVSAIGAEPVLMDSWAIDFVAVGPQKALAGPNGIGAVGISERGWKFLEENEYAPRHSILSLLDYKNTDDGKEVYKVPDNIPVLEARACIEALKEVEEEGLSHVNFRHRLASASAIAGMKALGIAPWQKDQSGYSPLNTTIRIPEKYHISEEQLSGIVGSGDGELKDHLLRINHYGAHASQESVEEAIITIAKLFDKESDQALRAVRNIWGSENE